MSGPGGPEVSVVIPTRGRETRLVFVLEALAQQTLSEGRYEVIVVRDEDGAGPFATAPSGLSLRSLKSAGVSGPTRKRELGWRAAGGRLVVFTDDDCRPHPDWLQTLLARVSPGESTSFVQGRTIPDPDEAHLLYGLARSQDVRAPSDWYPTCNIAYPRALLERLNGFDESFYFGGEDTDLGIRARANGATRIYEPNAVVFHAVMARTLPAALRDAFRWPSLPLVVRKHPEHRAALYRPWVWKRRHATLVTALAGVIAARRTRLGLMACLPYLSDVLETPEEPTPKSVARQARHAPAMFATDLAEVIATVSAAVKHRVFLV